MANSELSINDQIAALLREINTDWRVYDHVSSENTESILRKKSLRPDILILEPGVPPICLETEFSPAGSVEADAASRLGEISAKTGEAIQVAIAIRIPHRFKSIFAARLAEELRVAGDFEFCVLTGEVPTHYERWPSRGFLRGDIKSIFTTIQGVAIPPSLVQKGADALEIGASEIAAILDLIRETHAGVAQKLSAALKQEANLQTFRMAATILINALVFQENLAGRSGGLETVPSVDEMFAGGINKTKVVREWSKILKINYWPIFGVAQNILLAIPAEFASKILVRMHDTASVLTSLNLGRSSDLSGVIFQRLISDRRFLATFYTTPASSALLNGLVFENEIAPNGHSWKSPEALTLRIADFACGTGSLLCSAYTEIRRHLEMNGVSSRVHHASFIENGLIGCDVMPSATHITASMLSSAYPEQRYNHTKILTLAFGRQPDGSVNLGALEFLATQGALSIIDTGAKGVGSAGENKISLWEVGGSGVQDGSFDVVVMNPPFTRLTGGGGKSDTVPLPMFAAFGTQADEQQLMSDRTKEITKGTAAHGNAGEASIFVQIAHNKTKDGGYIALVLPITFLTGMAWADCRELVRKNYSHITVVTISSSDSGSFAFSADTAIGECLLVARKGTTPASRLVAASLSMKPSAPYEGTAIAGLIRAATRAKEVASLDGPPTGGTPLMLGDIRVGEIISGPLKANEQWPLLRIADHSVAQVAHHLISLNCIWLPGLPKSQSRRVELCRLQDLGEVGPYHLDISGPAQSGGAARGPFQVLDVQVGRAATYPILNSHDAENERSLVVPFDGEAVPRIGRTDVERSLLDERRERIWETRSRLHFNTDFRFNSQSLVVAMTPSASLGGRAWPTFKMCDPDYEYVTSLWLNSTFGLLTYWWCANKSQDGRGSITTSAIENLRTVDPRILRAEQVAAARVYFEEIKERRFLIAHQLNIDPLRKELDEFILTRILELGEAQALRESMQSLRNKLAAEPSLHGGK